MPNVARARRRFEVIREKQVGAESAPSSARVKALLGGNWYAYRYFLQNSEDRARPLAIRN